MGIQRVDGINIQELEAKLHNLPEKEPPIRTVRDLLEKLKPKIEEASKKNYTHEEIALLLSSDSLKVRAHHIKEILRAKRKDIPSSEQSEPPQRYLPKQ